MASRRKFGPSSDKVAGSKMERVRQGGEKVAQKGRTWFTKLSDQLQQLPLNTVVLINVETGQYFTAPPAWNDVEQVEKQRPANDRAGYWMFRLVEGAHGKKEAGGVYSVGSVQAIA